jgi:hypothetical protein
MMSVREYVYVYFFYFNRRINNEYFYLFYMLVDLKRCVLNGENGQNGNFFLCTSEALNILCARPITSAEEIEFGYANDEVKAASAHLDLRVDVVRLINCVGLPSSLHPDTFFVINGALRLHCLRLHYQGRDVRFKVLTHLTEVRDCQGKSFATICFDVRATVLSNILKQQATDSKRKLLLYHCLDFLKCYYETLLKPEQRPGRAKVGAVKPRATLVSMYLQILEGAGYQKDQIPTEHTLKGMMVFVMAIGPLALKNLTCAPVSDKRFNFVFDVAWSSAALSEPAADLALKWVLVGMPMLGKNFKLLFSAIAAKVPRPDQLSLIDAYKADLAAWIAPPETVIAPAGGAAVGSSCSEEEEEEEIECEVRPFAQSLLF